MKKVIASFVVLHCVLGVVLDVFHDGVKEVGLNPEIPMKIKHYENSGPLKTKQNDEASRRLAVINRTRSQQHQDFLKWLKNIFKPHPKNPFEILKKSKTSSQDVVRFFSDVVNFADHGLSEVKHGDGPDQVVEKVWEFINQDNVFTFRCLAKYAKDVANAKEDQKVDAEKRLIEAEKNLTKQRAKWMTKFIQKYNLAMKFPQETPDIRMWCGAAESRRFCHFYVGFKKTHDPGELLQFTCRQNKDQVEARFHVGDEDPDYVWEYEGFRFNLDDYETSKDRDGFIDQKQLIDENSRDPAAQNYNYFLYATGGEGCRHKYIQDQLSEKARSSTNAIGRIGRAGATASGAVDNSPGES